MPRATKKRLGWRKPTSISVFGHDRLGLLLKVLLTFGAPLRLIVAKYYETSLLNFFVYESAV